MNQNSENKNSIEDIQNELQEDDSLKIENLTSEDYLNGITVSNQKICFPRENYLLSEFSSTLLIPERYIALFQRKIIQHKGVRSYVAYLLAKYKLYIANGLIPGYSNVTTKYQEKGQNLQKFAFRPCPADWAELKLYRVAFGMSISAFLIYLVIADSLDFAVVSSNYLEAVGIPSLPNWDLCAKIFLCQKRVNYTIIFQYRKSRYD